MNGQFERGDRRINRAGRPKKGQCLTDFLSYKLDQKDEATGKLNREIVAEKIIALAKEGNIAALRTVFDRVDGVARQTIELSGLEVSSKLQEILSDD